MAILDTTLEYINKELKKELDIDSLDKILFDFGLEIESYNKTTDELKIDITAERSDLLSEIGFIRALKAYLEISSVNEYKAKSSTYVLNIENSVKPVRPFSVCAVIKNLTLTDDKLKQIIWAQEKLHLTLGRKRSVAAIGIYPLDKINFPITFLSKQPKEISFIPLGETELFSGKDILEKNETGIAYASLLENKERYPVFVDSLGKTLSMPPIINSEDTGKVTTSTKDVFIECSGFNLARLNQILNIVCCMFADFGGEIYQVTINFGSEYSEKKIITPVLEYRKKIIPINELNSLISTTLTIDEIEKLLIRMQYTIKKINKEKIEVTIPPFRCDVMHTVDVADDLARSYGFNNINFKQPNISTIGGLTKESLVQNNIINVMTLLGYTEISPFSLSNKKELFENFLIPVNKDALDLGYSKDKNLDVIVTWLYPKLLKTLTNNQHRGYPQKIFSCNYVVIKDTEEENRSKNRLKLSAMTASSKISYTQTVSDLLTLCNVLGQKLDLEKKNYPFYLKDRSAEIIIDGKSVGHVGEINPDVLVNNDYFVPVVGFEIEILF
ncbi:MAG: phenylalanine--tRNA ligase subunit beta [Candidatus ainarchaeum sp.]|nr:phenylalanine--tRNA ligase subunit beta [Candidatus ainarchaeum sp.]